MSILKWGRYLRVSSEEQALPGTASIDAQDRDTAALIAREGGAIVETYCDDKRYYSGSRKVEPSGERTDRPEWRRLLADIRAGRVNAVAAWHSSRLYRNYRPAIDFLEVVDEFDVYVRLVTEGFDKRFAMLMAWRDREENKSRVDRIQMGQQAVAKQGFAPTRHSRFYRTIRNEDGERIGCELREEHRPFFDRLADLFLARLSYDNIALQLGHNPISGKRWHGAAISHLLHNPWFRGWVDYGREAEMRGAARFLAPGKHAPAWDAETVAAIEAELRRRDTWAQSVRHNGAALLAGLLRCGRCGHLLTAIIRRGRGKSKWEHTYYRCHAVYRVERGFTSGPGLPHAPNILSEDIALGLIEDIIHHLKKDDLAAAMRERFAAKSTSRAKVAVAPDQLQAQLTKWQTEMASLPETATYARVLLSTEIERAARALAEAEAEFKQRQPQPVINVDLVWASVLWLRSAGPLRNIPPERLRPVLSVIFEAIYIVDKDVTLPPALAAL